MVVAETDSAGARCSGGRTRSTTKLLPWNTDSEAAFAGGAPPVWDEVPDNVLVNTIFGDASATDRAFAAAAHVIRRDFRIGRVTAVPLEPRAALAHYDTQTQRYTLYAGSGGAVRQKHELASVLGIAADRLRVLSHDVGGNFGSRNRPYVEFGLVLWAARKLGRPVKYTATRSEAFLSDYQGRDLLTKVELALRSDGRFLAMRALNISNVGARCVSLSPLGKGAGLITGSYDIPAATLRACAVFTNTMPTNAYRSSGRPEVTFALERLIDIAAADLGFDRIELRRMNLIRPEAMPYTNAVGMTYDSGQYEANMDLAMRIADWDGFEARRRERRRSRQAARARSCELCRSPRSARRRSAPRSPSRPTIASTSSSARSRAARGTKPVSRKSSPTCSACRWPDINIITGDTDIVSAGGGSHSGRSLRHAATVMSKAAEELIARAKVIAARLLDASPDQIEFADGRFGARSTNRSFSLLELARELARSTLPDELKSSLRVAADNEMHDPVFPNGCAVCECEVDPETGGVELTRYAAVDDVGRCINPMIVHGQTHGGIAQGVGQALWEQCYLDPGSGQPVCGSLMDYGMPRSDDLPSFTTEIVEVLSPTNPFGIKAGGEGGTTPAPAAVISAIVNALSGFHIRDITMPATPFTVWQAIQKAKAAGGFSSS